MTKPYLITPEQALEIAKQCGLDIDLIDTTGEYVLSSRDSIYLSDLQEIINAALDKVLGEPVGEQIEIRSKLGDMCMFQSATVNKGDSYVLCPLGTKLYAPRREK